MKVNIKKIHIIALGALGGGLSGGDRIFIEFSRNWSKEYPVDVYVWEQGLKMCQMEHLTGSLLKINLIKVGIFSKLGFIFTYFYRIFLGIKLGLTIKTSPGDLIYSASEFWMDSIPAIIAKLRNPKVVWAAAWYQTAPNPFRGFSEGKRENLYRQSALLYWFVQQPIKPIITKFADFILVNNKKEQEQFNLSKAKIITVLGAVRTEMILEYQKKHRILKDKKYIAVFQGRFHPQKGVVELVDIWHKVVTKIPNAKLAMIGDGPLMNEVKNKIKKMGLEKDIDLMGYMHDSDKKYDIFNNSMIVVHPAFFDSGGMAAAEAMAFGLPCVGFDLVSYNSYYPKGMIKTQKGNLDGFSENVIKLIKDKLLYKKIGNEAKEMILRNFSWENRSEEVMGHLRSNNDS